MPNIKKTLYLVGIGPGDPMYMTPQAQQAITESTDIVGYGLYIDLIADRVKNKKCHTNDLGEETQRARLALDLAGQGHVTSLVSSGDIGIYAMATLVFELIDKELQPHWADIDLITVPGITAAQLAASKVGAPLGHDMCTISLSDLLTPWEVIEKRLHAAGQGDFVVAIYNPVSKTRNWQFDRARDILLQYKSGMVPVIIAKNLGRDGEVINIVALDKIRGADLDMLTTVIVGNTESRNIQFNDRDWVYTPRGYAKRSTEA